MLILMVIVSLQLLATEGSKKCWGARHSQLSRRSRDSGGRSSVHPQPNPYIFYCLLGGVFLFPATATAKTRKSRPTDSPKYRLFHSPFAFVSISPCLFPVFLQLFVFALGLRLSSSDFRLSIFSSWFSVFVFLSLSFIAVCFIQ